MVKSVCFLSRGHVYKTRGVKYVCLRRLSSQIVARRWVPCSTNKRSHTPIWSQYLYQLTMYKST